jgi:hypothetical protein
MGNAHTRHVNLSSLTQELDKTVKYSPSQCVRQIVVTATKPQFKVTIPLGGEDNFNGFIIKNIKIPNLNFKSITLTINTVVFHAELKDDMWIFTESIPLFKIPNDVCYLTIYSEGIIEHDFDIQYDSYMSMPENVKIKCMDSPVVFKNTLYKDGTVL